MPDQATMESVARKFQTWAESLSPDEQSALAGWLEPDGNGDVEAHSTSAWWQEPSAWSKAWMERGSW
jgi:hypothetical protein